MESIALAALVVLGYGLVSGRLEGTSVTGPMLFVAAGLALGGHGLGILETGFDQEGVRILAEATLVVVLFTDAIAIRLPQLEREIALPARLLGLGLPLTIAVATGVGALVLERLSLWETALVAAILAPTDAALGQAVVADERVPQRIRQTLTTESGLNDGLVLPVVTLFAALAAGTATAEPAVHWARFAAEQIGYGLSVGVIVGALGGRAVDRAVRAGWMDGVFRQLGTLAIGVGAFAASELVGGNGFIAAFLAGLAFGQVARDQCPHVADFAEDQAHLLALLTFLLFGAILVGPALDDLTPPIALYTLASLTVVRGVPVALSLLGAGLDREAVAFVAWFGPRGLASILFAVFALQQVALPHGDQVLTVVTWTVLLSVLAHGLTAAPWAGGLGARHRSRDPAGSLAPGDS